MPSARPPKSTAARLLTTIVIVCGLVTVSALLLRSTRLGPVPPCTDFNVVILVLDAASARYFGAYGNPLPATPRFDEFVGSATVFERAYSQAPATVRSVMSYMTGKYAPQPREAHRTFRLGDEETIATLLDREGYKTAAFSQNPWVSPKFGFEKGFDDFTMHTRPSMKFLRPEHAPKSILTPVVLDVLHWLETSLDQKFLLYVHLLPPHAPYLPPPQFWGTLGDRGDIWGRDVDIVSHQLGTVELSKDDVEKLRIGYQENLAFADAQIGIILRYLTDREEVLGRTLIVVTADHGEGFLEHGRIAHGTTVYDEMVHVPLAIHWPRCVNRELPLRSSDPVELRQILATIRDLLDEGDARDSLLNTLLEDSEPRAVRSDVVDPFRKITQRMVVRGSDKLILSSAGEPELYDLSRDPGETTNLAADMPGVVDELRALLDSEQEIADSSRMDDLDNSTREKLRALGYHLE